VKRIGIWDSAVEEGYYDFDRRGLRLVLETGSDLITEEHRLSCPEGSGFCGKVRVNYSHEHL